MLDRVADLRLDINFRKAMQKLLLIMFENHFLFRWMLPDRLSDYISATSHSLSQFGRKKMKRRGVALILGQGLDRVPILVGSCGDIFLKHI